MSTHRKITSKLVRKCPVCKRLRKFKEPPGDQGGVVHDRRPVWGWAVIGMKLGSIELAGRVMGIIEYKRVKACGWCVARLNNQPFVDTGIGGAKRDAKTGRVIKEKR